MKPPNIGHGAADGNRRPRLEFSGPRRRFHHGPGPETSIQEPPVPRHSEATLAAIKNAVDIVALVGEYCLPCIDRAKFKALCPFHDDHNPSLELNPERQSFKCWSCGAGGDVFDFVKDYRTRRISRGAAHAGRTGRYRTREPVRWADGRPRRGRRRASCSRSTPGPSRSSPRPWPSPREARAYVDRAGDHAGERRAVPPRLCPRRPRLADSPEPERAGTRSALLEQAGLVVPTVGVARLDPRAVPGPVDLPDPRPAGPDVRVRRTNSCPVLEQHWPVAGKTVAKYLNSPETALFQKRQTPLRGRPRSARPLAQRAGSPWSRATPT